METTTMIKAIENGIFEWEEIEDYHIEESKVWEGPYIRMRMKDGSEFNIIVEKI